MLSPAGDQAISSRSQPKIREKRVGGLWVNPADGGRYDYLIFAIATDCLAVCQLEIIKWYQKIRINQDVMNLSLNLISHSTERHQTGGREVALNRDFIGFKSERLHLVWADRDRIFTSQNSINRAVIRGI